MEPVLSVQLDRHIVGLADFQRDDAGVVLDGLFNSADEEEFADVFATLDLTHSNDYHMGFIDYEPEAGKTGDVIGG